MIEQEFLSSLKTYSADERLHRTMWDELAKNYNSSGRHYHNLTHLEALLAELKPYKDQFASWDVIVLAIAYHDAIYNTLKTNNEERSAELAVKRLKSVPLPESVVASCEKLILATKKHEPGDNETNLFTDADLSILGTDAESYTAYAKQIRKEYSIYPDLVYNPGRKKVLEHFLGMERIYKTDEFVEKYEVKARKNLMMELKLL